MRIGLFGYEGDALFEAARAGLRRLGHEIVVQISNCWTPESAMKNLDGAVVCGNRGRAGEAARYYSDRGKPVCLIDFPHLGRGGNSGLIFSQYRVSPVDHAWLPDIDPDPARLDAIIEAFELEIEEPRVPVKGQRVLVLGQRSGDPTHGMNRNAMQGWAESVTEEIHRLCEYPVIWRPHPTSVYPINGADEFSDPRKESLEDAFERSRLVVTVSSNAGLKAIMAGLPVIADGEPVYKRLTFRLSEWNRVKAPPREDVIDFLRLVAHTQWTRSEIATGEPFAAFLPDEIAWEEPEVTITASVDAEKAHEDLDGVAGSLESLEEPKPPPATVSDPDAFANATRWDQVKVGGKAAAEREGEGGTFSIIGTVESAGQGFAVIDFGGGDRERFERLKDFEIAQEADADGGADGSAD